MPVSFSKSWNCITAAGTSHFLASANNNCKFRKRRLGFAVGHSYISFNKVHNNPERIKRFQRALQITSNYVASMKMPRSLAGNAKGHNLACLCGAYRETVEIPQCRVVPNQTRPLSFRSWKAASTLCEAIASISLKSLGCCSLSLAENQSAPNTPTIRLPRCG